MRHPEKSFPQISTARRGDVALIDRSTDSYIAKGHWFDWEKTKSSEPVISVGEMAPPNPHCLMEESERTPKESSSPIAPPIVAIRPAERSATLPLAPGQVLAYLYNKRPPNRREMTMSTTVRNVCRERRPTGFTSTELPVVIGVLAILLGILPLSNAGFKRAQLLIEVRSRGACSGANAFRDVNGTYPDSLTSLGEFLGSIENERWIAQGDGTMLIDGGYLRLRYAVDPDEIYSHLDYLRTLDDSDESEAFIATFAPGHPWTPPMMILTTINPVHSTISGYQKLFAYVNLSECQTFFTMERAEKPATLDPVQTAALQSVAIMLQSDTDPRKRARETLANLRDPEMVQFFQVVFDRNLDSAITLSEFSQASRRLADQPVDDDSTVGQRVTKQFFGVVVNEFALTADDDSSNEILFHMDEAPEDPTELFSYQNLCDHTGLYVADDQIKNRICRRLKLAAFLEENALLLPRDKVLTSQQRRLQRLSGDALPAEAADELDLLFEVRKGFGK
jgi:hypothetical protein